MRKIRQHNDIDIVVTLKNDEGAVLDATFIKEYKVFLTQVGYRLRIEDYQILPDGRIGFRFHAANQRVGVYSIVVTAVTTDDRVFTTDVCNAFALVRCSCDAEDGSSDAEIEALEVNATFEVTAWGGGGGTVQTSLNYYDDGTGKVVPVKHPDLSTQPSILPYKFAGNYVYEQMVFVTSEQSNNNDSVTLVKFSDFGLKDGKKILLDYNICQMRDEGGFIDIYRTLPFNIVAENEKIVLGRVSGAVTPDMWIRVVWTSEPKSGGYYYASEQESGITFENNSAYNITIDTERTTTDLVVLPLFTRGTLSYSTPELSMFLNESDGVRILSDANHKFNMRLDAFIENSPIMERRIISIPFIMDLQTGDSTGEISHLQTECPELYVAIKNGKNVKFNIHQI